MSRYDAWMAKQPPEFQDDVLGEKIANNFRTGVFPLLRFRAR